ncbi:MAG: ribosome biogenesis GTPase Der [Ekhidna sp.]|nr:ribosome biogenesis GTPase Der [Ekhidna sp.]
MSNILAIVGRPNVGKSTLFNRLVERRQAIMDNESGVTRDRHYGHGEWNGKPFTAIDTGGYVEGSDDIFEEAIRRQVKEALKEASVILFMVDCDTGLHGLDQNFANVIREIDKPVYLAANKADNRERMLAANEFYSLGLNAPIFPIAAISGSGTGDLLDEVANHFKDREPDQNDLPKISILGRPNVGKSSFVNVLIGKERSIVTNVAGTTRDATDTRYNLYGKDFLLTDTAGIRRKSKVHENIEFYSVMRAIRAIRDSDVCIVMIDAQIGLTSQDMNIIGLADKHKKGIILMVNKWDLIEKSSHTANEFRESIENKLGHLSHVPIIFTSVMNKQRVMQTLELALNVYENRLRKVPTSKLNEIIGKEIESYPPPAVRGRYIKIKYMTQLPTQTPTFAFFCNFPQHIKEPYQRYLTNKLRKHFDFKGVPVKVVFRKK